MGQRHDVGIMPTFKSVYPNGLSRDPGNDPRWVYMGLLTQGTFGRTSFLVWFLCAPTLLGGPCWHFRSTGLNSNSDSWSMCFPLSLVYCYLSKWPLGPLGKGRVVTLRVLVMVLQRTWVPDLETDQWTIRFYWDDCTQPPDSLSWFLLMVQSEYYHLVVSFR